MIAANNGYLLAFDNLSGLPIWLSDALCRLASGGGFAVRQLYTDDEEVLFEAARPTFLNGIEEVISRPDLGDRAIFLTWRPLARRNDVLRASCGASSKSRVPLRLPLGLHRRSPATHQWPWIRTSTARLAGLHIGPEKRPP
jgi:hypothetical protein